MLYRPPFLLIDQTLGKNGQLLSFMKPSVGIHSQQDLLYYNRDFIGISAPEQDEDKLERLHQQLTTAEFDRLNFQFFVLAISSSSLVLTETDINKSEILNIPYSEDSNFFMLSYPEKILQADVLKYYIHSGKAITGNSRGSIFHKRVTEPQLKSYGITFCNTLNEIYGQGNKNWQLGSIFQNENYTIVQFGFGTSNELEYRFGKIADDSISSLIENSLSNSGVIYKRVIRIYEHINGYDCVFFIKPNTLRYWLDSIAVKDTDDTFIDLKNAGF